MDSSQSSVEVMFSRSKSLASTCFFELWDGVSTAGNNRSLLFKSKNSLQELEISEAEYKVKLDKVLEKLKLSNQSSGIDSSGYAYVIFDFKNLKSLESECVGDFNKRLSIYIKCLQKIDEFNDIGINVYDLSLDAFKIDSEGQIYPFGVLATLLWNPTIAGNYKPIFPYLASNIKMGESPDNHSEVFSAGVLGYAILCSKKYIKNDESGFSSFISKHSSPSSLDQEIPTWFDNILAKALEDDSSQRFKNVDEFLSEIEQCIRFGKTVLPAKSWASTDGVVVRQIVNDVSKKQGQELISEENKSEDKKKTKAKKNKTQLKHAKTIIKIIWGTTILGVIALVFSLLTSYKVIQVVNPEIPQVFVPVMPIVKQYNLEKELYVFVENDGKKEANLGALKALVMKDYGLDLVILNYLSGLGKKGDSEYQSVISGMLEYWLEKFGYKKTKEEVSKILSSSLEKYSNIGYPEIASLVLTATNPQSAAEQRVSQLRKLFQKDEALSFSLVGLLGDESSEEVFLPVLRDFLSARGFVEIPKSASKRALYMLSEETRKYLGDNTEELLKSSSTDEIRLIATALLSNVVKVDKDFFQLALRIFIGAENSGKFSDVFIQLAQNESVNNSAVAPVVFKLILGTATAKDLGIFIEWNNLHWERLMCAVLATSNNDALSERAFEVISRRGPTIKIADKLLEWIKKNNWSSRSKYAYPFGVFALKDLATDEELEKAFNVILPISNSTLFNALVSTEDQYFITQAVERISPIVKVSDILPFLSHENPNVRIAAVKGLVGKNDLSTLQKILANFRKEKDPEVIKVYNEYHWVTQDRQRPAQ